MSKTNTTATRLITLIMLLQRQPNQKATDLAKGALFSLPLTDSK